MLPSEKNKKYPVDEEFAKRQAENAPGIRKRKNFYTEFSSEWMPGVSRGRTWDLEEEDGEYSGYDADGGTQFKTSEILDIWEGVDSD